MEERRRRNKLDEKWEFEVRQSLKKLESDIDDVRNDLKSATHYVDRLTQYINQLDPETVAKDTEGVEKRFQWLMVKERKMKEFKRLEEIKEYFEFRLSDYVDPHMLPDSKFGSQRIDYSDLVYDDAW